MFDYRILLQRCLLGFLVLCAMSLVGCSVNTKETEEETMKKNKYCQITMTEAVEMMKTETNYIILDARTHEEYNEGHIPGAICIPNETIGSGDLSALPDKDQLILVYCRSGNRSKQASEKLVLLGYTNIVEFGGIRDWTGDIVTN
ncbi:MAG: rhodanese-like domain-containing protein [Lachnospiraceae bacterium]|nr:rhodanese-like domain-containing protein [Lachnospiraceae bacterium]